MKKNIFALLLISLLALFVSGCGQSRHSHQKKLTQQPTVDSDQSSSGSSTQLSRSPDPVPSQPQLKSLLMTKKAPSLMPLVDAHSVKLSSSRAQSLLIAQQLLHRLRSYSCLSANFRQMVIDDGASPATDHYGRLLLKRPDRFLWETYKTNKQRNIDEKLVGKGSFYWQYDPDLQQAIKRKVDLDQQPLIKLLLSDQGSAQELAKDFILTVTTASGSTIEEYMLKTRDGGPYSDLSSMTIAIDAKTGALIRLILANTLSQRTIFAFSHVSTQPIDDDVFNFTPGSDVDVVDETQSG